MEVVMVCFAHINYGMEEYKLSNSNYAYILISTFPHNNNNINQ